MTNHIVVGWSEKRKTSRRKSLRDVFASLCGLYYTQVHDPVKMFFKKDVACRQYAGIDHEITVAAVAAFDLIVQSRKDDGRSAGCQQFVQIRRDFFAVEGLTKYKVLKTLDLQKQNVFAIKPA